MDDILDNLVGGTVSTLTPFGCIRNCMAAIMLFFLAYVALVVVFIVIQGT
jgi:hypothetical protein